MARIVFQGPGSDVAETMMRAPSSSRDATMAMPDDLAMFSEELQPPADSVTAQKMPPPPVAAPSEAKMVMPEQPTSARKGGSNRRTLGIIGLVLILVVVACVASAFLLDALVAPETLYCGPAQGIFELLGNLFGYDLACG
jgi:hypothetical protein